MDFVQQHYVMIDSFARSVQAGTESFGSIAAMMGGSSRGQLWADAVKDRLATWGAATPAAELRRIIMQSRRAQRESQISTMQALIAAGCDLYQPKQEVYTAVVRVHLDCCEAGEYPTAASTALVVAGDKSPKLLAKANKQRLRKAFNENKQHPGMLRINNLVSNSTITAAVSGTVSSCLGALADTHKIACLIGEQQRHTKALEARLAIAEAAAARANARLDIKDAGKDWKEAARAIRTVEPTITNTALGLRVGKSEAAIRKYLNSVGA
jgi:hypothetical protein